MSTLSVYRSPLRSRLALRDPFTEFDAVVRQAFGPTATAGFSPAAEVVRDGDDAVVRLEIPGVEVDKDVTVELTDGRLVIRGERRDEHSEQRAAGTVREVRYGSFRRSFALPKTVTADDIRAGYDAGILSVRVAGAYAGPSTTRIAVAQADGVTPISSYEQPDAGNGVGAAGAQPQA
jgi:HSP20 family molecular chaperone IbpA